MGKRVRISRDYIDVMLPDDPRPRNAGDLVDLTDAEFAGLPPSLTRALTDTGVVIADPTRFTSSSFGYDGGTL